MGRTQIVYDPKIAQDINSKLMKLAQNPRGFSVKQIVTEVSDAIVDALEAGHNWEDILSIFSEFGVEIKKTTVQRYLRQLKSKSTEKDPPPLQGDTTVPVVVVDQDSKSDATEAIAISPSSESDKQQPKQLADTQFVEIDEKDL